MAEKQIVAGSGGFQYAGGYSQIGPIIKYVLKLTGKNEPRFCFVGTASGDSPVAISNFYNACLGHSIKASHIQLYPFPNHKDLESHILSQDAIWVTGGSVANLIAVWKVHGLFEIFRKAWENGIVLSGISAGSICWSAGGTTDSFGPDLQIIHNDNAILPFSSGVHYDSEEQRRPLFQKLIKEGELTEGYASDDGVALHFIGTKLHKAIADEEGKAAYRVYKSGGRIIEERIEPELLK